MIKDFPSRNTRDFFCKRREKMQIVLNGVSENIEKEMLISEFIEKLSSEKNINLSGAVVLLNDELIKRDNWKDVSIKENDEIEVLTFVSGG